MPYSIAVAVVDKEQISWLDVVFAEGALMSKTRGISHGAHVMLEEEVEALG